MLLLGTAGAMFWPTLEAWIAEKESKRTLMQKMTLFNISWSTGFAVGPLVGGILFGMNFKLPFYFAFFVSVLVLFVLFYRTPKVSFSSKSKTFTGKTLLSGDPPDSFSLYIRISRMANFILCLCLGMVRYIFPKLATELQISPSFLGLLFFILALSLMLTFYGLGRVHRWHYRIFPLVLFQLIAAVGLVIIFIASSFPLFFLAFVFIGVGLGMSFSSSLFYSVNVTSQKGPSAAIHETVLMSGFLLGPLIGGAVAQKLSLRAPYLAFAAIVVVGIFTQLLFKRRYDLLENK
jgi:MFS family permease